MHHKIFLFLALLLFKYEFVLPSFNTNIIFFESFLPKNLKVDSIKVLKVDSIETLKKLENFELLKFIKLVCRDEYKTLVDTSFTKFKYVIKTVLVKLYSDKKQKINAEIIEIKYSGNKKELVFSKLKESNICKQCLIGEFKTEYGYISLLNHSSNKNNFYFLKLKSKVNRSFIKKYWKQYK